MKPDREVERPRERKDLLPSGTTQAPTTQTSMFLGEGWGGEGWGAGNQKGLLGAMLTTAGQDCEGKEFLHTQAGPEREE